jgi:hypothetical protein
MNEAMSSHFNLTHFGQNKKTLFLIIPDLENANHRARNIIGEQHIFLRRSLLNTMINPAV